MATFKRDIAALQNQQFDVLIIGGGISGAWLALHAARSGYSTALIEQSDYASQTSSSSSKLLHGGVRYLQQFEFSKVRESAMERAHCIYAAPHLSQAVPFLVPTYKNLLRSKLFLNCGMLAYRFLTLGENRIIGDPQEHLPPISSLSKTALDAILDLGDEPHTGAVQLFERHMVNSERMVLAILQSAAAEGAVITNYCCAQTLQREANVITGAMVQDRISGSSLSVNARLVINAAGPWIDELNCEVNNKAASINGFAVGSHIVTRQISSRAIALTTKHQSNAKLDRGGRHIFVIPWCGYSLIGTSYEEIEKPERDLVPAQSHVEQLLEAVNDALPSARLNADDLITGYSGLYPLRTEDIQNTVYQGSGEYVVVDHSESDQIEGLVTALGAKFTTGRKLSELTMARVQKKLGGKLSLSKVRLNSSQYTSFSDFSQRIIGENAHIDAATLQHLLQLYGSEVEKILVLCKHHPSLLEPISSKQLDVKAQLVYAARAEQALTLEDALFRRTSVGFFGMSDTEVQLAGELIATELSWSNTEIQSQVTAVTQRLADTGKTLSNAAERVAAAKESVVPVNSSPT